MNEDKFPKIKYKLSLNGLIYCQNKLTKYGKPPTLV